MRRVTRVLFTVSVLIGLPGLGRAMLVEDPTEWAKTMAVYKTLVQQLHTDEERYAMLESQYRELKLLKSDAEGHYGYGGFLNGVSDLRAREWSPANWEAALKGLSGSNPARYQQLLRLYRQTHPTLSQAAFAEGASKAKTQVYRNTVQTNEAASVNASYAFNTVQHHLETIYKLSSQIEHTQNTKAATDLNARLLAELAYINVQQVKMQAVLNEQLAAQSAQGIAAQTSEAQFNRLPP